MNTYNINDMLNKTVNYNNKEYSIENYEINSYNHNIPEIYFQLVAKKDVRFIPVKNIKTNDVELNEFISKCTKDFNEKLAVVLEQEEVANKEKMLLKAQEEKEAQDAFIKRQKADKERGLLKGQLDARNKVSALYKLFISDKYSDKLKVEKYSKEYKDAYVVGYQDEKKVMKQLRLVQVRANQSTLSDYPGDVDELVKWMKKNISRVDVFAPTDKIDNEQSAVDVLNQRDNTNYTVKVKNGEFISYEAYFKNPETAPKEFLEWYVSKHDYTTSDLSKRVMEHPMSIKTGKLSCNSLIKELLYSDEYRFHVGKYA